MGMAIRVHGGGALGGQLAGTRAMKVSAPTLKSGRPACLIPYRGIVERRGKVARRS